MSKELSKEFETFCESFHIKSAEDLKELSSMLEEVVLFGLPLSNGGFIGISNDGYCKFCNMEVFKKEV
jgi:hypothetical protein